MLHNLQIAIKEKFRTQLACAKAADIHPVRLNRICRGWVAPTPIERDRLTRLLGVEAGWLFATLVRIPPAVNRSNCTSSDDRRST
jgi:hypothetical protein